MSENKVYLLVDGYAYMPLGLAHTATDDMEEKILHKEKLYAKPYILEISPLMEKDLVSIFKKDLKSIIGDKEYTFFSITKRLENSKKYSQFCDAIYNRLFTNTFGFSPK